MSGFDKWYWQAWKPKVTQSEKDDMRDAYEAGYTAGLFAAANPQNPKPKQWRQLGPEHDQGGTHHEFDLLLQRAAGMVQ